MSRNSNDDRSYALSNDQRSCRNTVTAYQGIAVKVPTLFFMPWSNKMIAAWGSIAHKNFKKTNKKGHATIRFFS